MSAITKEENQNKTDLLIIDSGCFTYNFVANTFVPKETIKSGFYSSFLDQKGAWHLESHWGFIDREMFNKTLKVYSNEEDYFPIENYHTTFQNIRDDVESFLSNRDFYTNNSIQYRRSYLIYGDAGIGKTRFFNHLTKKLIRDYDAICMNFASPRNFLNFYEHGYENYSKVLRERLKIYIIDEFSEFTDVHGNESKNEVNHALLNMLDNPECNENVLFFFCTNHPESIPDNIIDRPSRIDVLKEAGMDAFDKERFIKDWYQFIMKKPFPMDAEGKTFLKKCEMLSPAYFKEIFIYAFQRNMSILEAYEIQMERKRMIADRFKKAHEKKNTSKKKAGFDIEEENPDFEDDGDFIVSPNPLRKVGNVD